MKQLRQEELQLGKLHGATVADYWHEVKQYSDSIATGRYGHLPDGRSLEAGYATGLETGSFKERGALAYMLHLARLGVSNVVAYSAGNHAAGVALGARELGMTGTVYVPEYTPDTKVQNTLRLGDGAIKVVKVVGDIEAAHRAAESAVRADTSREMVSPSDMLVGLGQGTIAHELLTKHPDIDNLLVPAGYGGLALGCVVAIRQLGLKTKVYGVKLSSRPELCEGAHVDSLSSVAQSVFDNNPDLWGGLLYVDPADVGAVIEYEDASRGELEPVMGRAAFDEYPEATALLSVAGARKYHSQLPGSNAVLITGSNADQQKLDALHDEHVSLKRQAVSTEFNVASGYHLRRKAA